LLMGPGKPCYEFDVSSHVVPAEIRRPARLADAAHAVSLPGFLQLGRRRPPPFFVIDSHPVVICKLIRAGKDIRLDGLARTGYCASMKTYFHGVREHLIYTPEGRIAFIQQIPGNRHDVNGLYALLKTSFKGSLL